MRRLFSVFVATLGAPGAHAVVAGEQSPHGQQQDRADVAAPAAPSPYRAECGSCHLAYPMALLSAREWGIVLSSLRSHYGVEVEIDDATLGLVARQLEAPSSASPGENGRLPRITSKAWFIDEHDDVAASVFRSSAVKGAANCTACHAGAERGDFDDDAVRLPGGQRHD
jgi:hypothetical protein